MMRGKRRNAPIKLPINYETATWLERKQARERYVKLQHGKCWWCNADLCGPPAKSVTDKQINKKLFPPGFFKSPVHLHHCRSTEMTVGAVHAMCNAVLWEYYGQ